MNEPIGHAKTKLVTNNKCSGVCDMGPEHLRAGGYVMGPKL